MLPALTESKTPVLETLTALTKARRAGKNGSPNTILTAMMYKVVSGLFKEKEQTH